MTQKEHTLPAELAALAEKSQNNFQRWLTDLDPVSGSVIAVVAASSENTELSRSLFDPAHPRNAELFGDVHEKYPQETKAVLDRSLHSAERLAEFAEGTNLTRPDKGLGIEEARGGLAWLVDIQPWMGEYIYQEHIDLLRRSIDQQMKGVKDRLLPHSLAAGLVSYYLANELNKTFGKIVIDPFHVLIQNLLHESQRMVTHHVKAHDDLLVSVMKKGLGHTEFVQDHGEDHPRILDPDAEELTTEQLVQFILWMGDAFTKASPSEADPFATEDGKPHFRVANRGKADVLNSLSNYGPVLEHTLRHAQETGMYVDVLLQAFQNHHQMEELARQYAVDMTMLATVPQMFEERGVSLQNALDAVEPVWAVVLKKFFNNTTITKEEMYAELEQGLEAFLAAHPLYVPKVATH